MNPNRIKTLDFENPFANDFTTQNSSYYANVNGVLQHRVTEILAAEPVQFIHRNLRSFVTDQSFPCLGAKSAFNNNTYRFGFYPRMNSLKTTQLLLHDIWYFVQEQKSIADNFTTFIAGFAGPIPSNEKTFEKMVWKQLQTLHNLDPFDWDTNVSPDPESENFSLSLLGRAFFIVGLSPCSSRYSRRFAYPVLVFNAHYQFDLLRQNKKFEPMQRAIRGRDSKLQGNINPNLADFGEASESRQYSGRKVEPDWKCPFHQKKMK